MTGLFASYSYGGALIAVFGAVLYGLESTGSVCLLFRK